MQTTQARERAISKLKCAGFRVTPSRIELLLKLETIGHPVSAQQVLDVWPKAPNQATVYRMLNDLSEADIIKRVVTLSGPAHFEYTPEKPHHHHAVCTDCGAVEDIEGCFISKIQKDIIKDLKKFSSLESHSLEFFGHCKKCSK